MERDAEKIEVPSVEMAIRILDYLSRYKSKRSTLTEIHKKLGVNKSTCLRVLRTLKKHQYVFYDEAEKKYGLGVSLIVLGTRAAEFSDALEIVRPFVRKLVESTQLTTVIVQQRSKDHLMYVIKEEPNSAICVHVNIGQYFPISPSSFGKCFLAYMDKEEKNRLIKMIQTKRFTPKTITDAARLEEELSNVIKNGYAVSREELTLGVTGIASPVFDMYGKVNMAVLCLGVSAYVDEEMVSSYAEIIKKTASEMTKELGGVNPHEYVCSSKA